MIYNIIIYKNNIKSSYFKKIYNNFIFIFFNTISMKKQLFLGLFAVSSLALLAWCWKKEAETPEVIETKEQTNSELNNLVNKVVENKDNILETAEPIDSWNNVEHNHEHNHEHSHEHSHEHEGTPSDHELGINHVHNHEWEEYLDLSFEEAKKLANSKGATLRVVAVDWKENPITDDLVEGRVNISLVDNIVTNVDIEHLND